MIATPDHWHLKMTTEALAAGKHVYIEKPMTWSLDEGPKIIAAEKKAGKVLELHSYNANHAFANPTGDNYDAADARQAWDHTAAFLKLVLG